MKKNLESLMLEVYYEFYSKDYAKVKTLLELIYLKGHQDCLAKLKEKKIE